MECDAEPIQAKATQQDSLARMHTYTSSSKHSININRMLDVCQILLSLQEMDLEVWEVKLEKKQVHDLCPFDGQDLSAKLEELHARVDRVEDECTTETGKLLMLVVGISNALVDLKMLHIQDIP
jgi:hypothetical protein